MRPLIALLLLPVLASAAPLTIDLTTPIPPPTVPPYGPGTSTSPDGHTITADSYSMLLDGKRWTPVGGEFHYDRYPRAEWRDELLKMKAGGISVVSTYVFWIVQEEEPGKFDWSGQRSLRDFLLLCKELDLKVFVRLGPWCHGEMRNGGIPDWAQYSGAKMRSTDPKFLDMVKPLYAEEAKQMQGLLWKDGGPVIGIQVDNENGNAPYLRALKQMAQDAGIDVPYYAMTGWDIKPLDKDFLLLFGAYFDGFWGGTLEKYRRDFMFTGVRASNNLGAQMNDRAPQNSDYISQFPYLCVEIGPGMMSSYAKRIKVDPDAVTAMALVKMGEGSNMPGYYMYQGGMNPDSKLSPLQETHPNFMPQIDYDFQTCLGACGQVREQFHLLYEQHLFLQDFGSGLAGMPAFFPDVKPAGVDDFDTLRWDVRSDGTSGIHGTSGYIFFTNKQPYTPLPDHRGVQFELKTAGDVITTIPREPMTIPDGSYGFFPFNMNCDNVILQYATAQPLCRIDEGKGKVTYFFTALDGIDPELALYAPGSTVKLIGGAVQTGSSQDTDSEGADHAAMNRADDFLGVSADSNATIVVNKKDGSQVMFAVLSPEQGRHIARVSFAGRDRLIFSNASVIQDGSKLRLESENADDLKAYAYPAVPTTRTSSTSEWLFTEIPVSSVTRPKPLTVAAAQIQPATSGSAAVSGTEEAAWDSAAIYKLSVPKAAASRRVILNIHYIGDMARLYIGDKLYDDNFFNGDPFAIALWRIPKDQWANLRLKVLPATDSLLELHRLPEQAKNEITSAQAAGTVGQVTVTAADQLELKISP